jgi:hypothetical protein
MKLGIRNRPAALVASAVLLAGGTLAVGASSAAAAAAKEVGSGGFIHVIRSRRITTPTGLNRFA